MGESGFERMEGERKGGYGVEKSWSLGTMPLELVCFGLRGNGFPP